MTTSINPPSSLATTPRKRRRRVLVTGLLTALLALGLGYWAWDRMTAPELPAFDLAEADPEVREAIEAAAAEVRAAPRSARAWGRLGMALVANLVREGDLYSFAQAERLDPRDFRWPYGQAIILQHGDPDASLVCLRRAVERCGPGTDGPQVRLAEVLLAQGQVEEAEEWFRRLAQARPDHPRALLGLARLACDRGELAQALDLLGRCAQGPLNQKAIHTLTAEVYRRQGQPLEAERAAAVADELPDDIPYPDPLVAEVARLKVGQVFGLNNAVELMQQGHYAEAIARAQKLARANPSSYQPWFVLAKTYIEMRELQAAELPLRQVIRLEPDMVQAHYMLGTVLFSQGKVREAVTGFRKAIALKPAYGEAHYNLGHCLTQLGDRPGAIAAFRDAVRCIPYHAEAHTNLGELLAQDGRRAEACEHLRQAVQLKPDEARAKKLLEELEEGKGPPKSP